MTDIARPFGKRLDNWTRLESTKNLIQAFEEDPVYGGAPAILAVRGSGVDTSDPRYRILEGVDLKTGGTFAHPDIAIQFAQWCSPKFALWVSRQIRHLMEYGEVNINYREWTYSEISQGLQYNKDDVEELYTRW